MRYQGSLSTSTSDSGCSPLLLSGRGKRRIVGEDLITADGFEVFPMRSWSWSWFPSDSMMVNYRVDIETMLERNMREERQSAVFLYLQLVGDSL